MRPLWAIPGALVSTCLTDVMLPRGDKSMVSDPETDDLIRWSEDGDSFFGEQRHDRLASDTS